MFCDIEVRWNEFDSPEVFSVGTIPPDSLKRRQAFMIQQCPESIWAPFLSSDLEECVRRRPARAAGAPAGPRGQGVSRAITSLGSTCTASLNPRQPSSDANGIAPATHKYLAAQVLRTSWPALLWSTFALGFCAPHVLFDCSCSISRRLMRGAGP